MGTSCHILACLFLLNFVSFLLSLSFCHLFSSLNMYADRVKIDRPLIGCGCSDPASANRPEVTAAHWRPASLKLPPVGCAGCLNFISFTFSSYLRTISYQDSMNISHRCVRSIVVVIKQLQMYKKYKFCKISHKYKIMSQEDPPSSWNNNSKNTH